MSLWLNKKEKVYLDALVASNIKTGEGLSTMSLEEKKKLLQKIQDVKS